LRGGVFEARVDAAMYYINNMELTPDSVDAVNQFGLELAPGSTRPTTARVPRVPSIIR